MAIRVIEVPSSVRFDPPPRACHEYRREPTIHMKKPVGVLGWTTEEHERYARTRQWPVRGVETPNGPPGLSLTSLPSEEYLRGYLDALKQQQPRDAGRKSDLEKHIWLALECLKETDNREEEARDLYVKRSGQERDTASRQFSRALKFLRTLWKGD